MGFLKNIFGSSESKEEKVLPWQELSSTSQLSEIVEKSKTKAQVIFKHSTRCGISRMAMNQFVSSYNEDAHLDLYYLDLLNHRDISNEIASQFQVVHESPQLLVVQNGVVVAHESHGAVNDIDLARFE